MNQVDTLTDLIAAYRRHRLTRRQVLKRAGLGISAAALGALLAGGRGGLAAPQNQRRRGDTPREGYGGPSGYIFGQNFEREDLDFHEQAMRQAMSHAIDRQAIVQALLHGFGDPWLGPIPPADRFYDPTVEQSNQFDLETAKSLVADLGWTPGDDGVLTKHGTRMAFNLVVQEESFNLDLGSAIQAQLRELGMEVTVEALDRGGYFNALIEGSDSHLFFLWAAPMDLIIPFVSTATRGNPNWGRASVPAVDDAIAGWQQAPNDEALVAAGNRFQLAVAEHLPTIPLVVRDNIRVQRANGPGWRPDQYDLFPHNNYVWLDQ